MVTDLATCRAAIRRISMGLIAGLCLAGPGGIATAQTGAASDTVLEREAIEAIVREYLLENPEIITEALTILQEREEQAELERQRVALIALQDEIYESGAPVMGNPDGDVTMVEFFDYQCSYCKRVLETVFEVTGDDPGLRVVFKEFPILGPASVVAARASLAAARQGLYAEFHHTLMAYSGRLSEEVIFAVAAEVGLDVDRLRIDMETPEVRDEINANMRLAQQLGIRGTPAFVIGGQVVPGAQSLQAMEALIEKARSS